MTVGENTVDLSGVAVAYDAFKMTKEGTTLQRSAVLRPINDSLFPLRKYGA